MNSKWRKKVRREVAVLKMLPFKPFPDNGDGVIRRRVREIRNSKSLLIESCNEEERKHFPAVYMWS